MNAEPRLPDAVQTIPEALAFWAERMPGAAAIIVPGRPAIPYAALWRRVAAVARLLAESGIGREDRVVLLLPEGVALTEALLGTMLAAVAVPLPAALTAPELHVSLHGLRAAAALVARTTTPAVRACLAHNAIPVLDLDDDGTRTLAGDPLTTTPWAPASWPGEQDLAAVRQTSGTTGRPKRIPCWHGTMVDNGRRNRDLLGLHAGDRTPAVTPLTTTLGQTVLSHAIVAGAALIMPPPGDFAAAWRAIARERPSWISTSAGYLELLARTLDAQPSWPPLPSLRFVQVTSAPIAPETCAALEQHLGAPILPRYSSTEAGGVAMTLPPPAKRKPGSVGQPVQEVRIVGLDGEDVAAGQEGEIWARGSRVMTGYLDDPETTAAALLPGGWYRTGDVGYLDEDGFLFLTGRLNELINRGGEKIAPEEVDRVLHGHPAIVEAATFAVSHAHLGEDIVAAVVFKGDLAPRTWELRAWLLERLAPTKVPRRFWVVDALPRTALGKVQRGALARRWREEQE